MAETQFHQLDKKTWHKWSFYLNLIVFIIIALSIAVLILDTYNAGKIASTGSGGDVLSMAWIYIVRDVAFLSVFLALIFFQFFRNLRTIIRRSW